MFDLGGVLAAISHTWDDAARHAGVIAPDLPTSTVLTALPGFDEYQAGAIPLEDYLSNLADFSGCSLEDALRLHNGILGDEYEGIEAVIRDIAALGIGTGCLSNTNAPHWEMLLNGPYPGFQSLQMKMASHLVGVNKPSPAIFARFQETFGLEPEGIAFFDDSPANVQAAQQCGWQAHWIDATQNTPAQLREHLALMGVF